MASRWDRFVDGITKGIENARDDIRHKLIEEGWFGKQVTDVGLAREHKEAWLGKDEPDAGTALDKLYQKFPNDPEIWVQPGEIAPSPMERPRQQSFDELWATDDRAKGVEPPEKDHGIDL